MTQTRVAVLALSRVTTERSSVPGTLISTRPLRRACSASARSAAAGAWRPLEVAQVVPARLGRVVVVVPVLVVPAAEVVVRLAGGVAVPRVVVVVVVVAVRLARVVGQPYSKS